MAKATKATNVSDTDLVTAHIKKLAGPLGAVVAALRKIILGADKEIGEQIKWNSPAFYYTGEMKPFDPKEYKRDIIVMNLHKGYPLLIFPTGATIKDTTGILEGDFKDGRRIVTIKDMDDVKAKAKSLKAVIKQWMKLIDK